MQRAVLFGLAGFLLARALPAPAADLTLTGAVEQAVRDNPELRSLRARWEAMRERPAQARALPNPMFVYGGMDLADGGEWPDTAEKRFIVEQEFPWFGKRGLRRELAMEDAETMRQELEAMTQDVVMQVKENVFDLQAVQRALALTRDEEGVLQRMQTIAETLYAAGERSQQDVIKAQAEITMLTRKQLELQAQETTLKAKLNSLLNRRADSPLVLAAAELPGDPEAELPALFALAEKARPEIRGAESQIRRSRAERDLMKKEFRPDVRLGLEYRNMAEEDDLAMFTIGFDLPVQLSKYRAGVREANNMIEAGRAALEAARREASFDVQDAHFKLLTARRTLDLYRSELIPQAESRFVASEAGYRAGQADFMDLLESERFLLEARIMAAMAEGAVGMQAARLERAVGRETRP